MAKFGEVFKESAVKKSAGHPRSETKWLHYTKLIDNAEQYRRSATKEDIADFAEIIKSTGKVLQDLLVRKAGPDTYEIIAGHHRRLACKYLVEEQGLTEFEFLPCKVENVDDVQAEFQLYATNAFMPKTDVEKLHEIERMKYLLENYSDQFKDVASTGRTIEKIAGIMKLGKTTIGDYVTISKNLGNKAMEQFEKGKINKSAALELAGLSESEQEELVEAGKTTIKQIKEYKEPKKETPQKAEVTESVAKTTQECNDIAETIGNDENYDISETVIGHEESVDITDVKNSEVEYDVRYYLEEQTNILRELRQQRNKNSGVTVKDILRQEYIVKGLRLLAESPL